MLGLVLSKVTFGQYLFRGTRFASLIPLDENDEPVVSEERAFQFWPESLEDTKQVNYQDKDIPGGSHPLKQWTSGGERTLSFTAAFARDERPTESDSTGDIFNPDLNAAVAWLRQFIYPTYPKGVFQVLPPAKLYLYLPNTKIGMGKEENGTISAKTGLGDLVLCVMTKCDVTYKAWFPDGTPRHIEVALAFSEVVQRGGRVEFVSASAFSSMARRYPPVPQFKQRTISTDSNASSSSMASISTNAGLGDIDLTGGGGSFS